MWHLRFAHGPAGWSRSEGHEYVNLTNYKDRNSPPHTDSWSPYGPRLGTHLWRNARKDVPEHETFTVLEYGPLRFDVQGLTANPFLNGEYAFADPLVCSRFGLAEALYGNGKKGNKNVPPPFACAVYKHVSQPYWIIRRHFVSNQLAAAGGLARKQNERAREYQAWLHQGNHQKVNFGPHHLLTYYQLWDSHRRFCNRFYLEHLGSDREKAREAMAKGQKDGSCAPSFRQTRSNCQPNEPAGKFRRVSGGISLDGSDPLAAAISKLAQKMDRGGGVASAAARGHQLRGRCRGEWAALWSAALAATQAGETLGLAAAPAFSGWAVRAPRVGDGVCGRQGCGTAFPRQCMR
eukprot:g2312.t1